MEHTANKKVKTPNIASVAVIGAGVSGIVTSRILLSEGHDVVVFEASDIGGVWAENYAGFGVQTPANLYEFPDQPLPKGSDFTPGPEMNEYIRNYADKHKVTQKVRIAKVDSVEPSDQGFMVHYTESGSTHSQYFDWVICSTGIYGKFDKYVPDWLGKEVFEGKIIHASDMVDPAMCEGKVVVVGYGKSAFDCAQVSAWQKADTSLLFRKAHWCVPRKILGLIPFEFATFSRFGGACLLPKWPNLGSIERMMHATRLLPAFWWLVAKIFKFQFGLKGDLIPDKGFIDDFWCGQGLIPDPSFFPMVHRKEIKAVKGEIKEIRAKYILLTSGEEIQCDVIIAATGYKADDKRSFLPTQLNDAREKDGFWLYRNMINPELPRFVFLNSNTSTFTNITTASVQGRWLAELMNGGFNLPEKDEMEAEIEKIKVWKRENMPDAGSARAYMIQTHQVHYYDELLRDMGASIWRKKGLFKLIKEAFDPYRPRDYKSIVTGEFKQRPDEVNRSESK
ncbi:MAG: NAD(P)/FAD-dependent oxidoreductase [Alteromonadaceae bacterium]|nr:NAD(P)/FAD-dependent oxidoreductase [Alteromonadaceae bacterium]